MARGLGWSQAQLALLAMILWGPAGCFVKLPQSPEQNLPGTLPDGKVIADLVAETQQPLDQPTYPDWRWWAADSSAPQDPLDFKPAEVTLPDDADGGGLVFEWVCLADLPAEDGTYPELPPEDFGGVVATHSFSRPNQVLGNSNQLTVYYVLCDADETYYVPERAYAFRLDEPTTATFQLSCDAPCYAFLAKSGCEYEHFEGCWVAADGEILVKESLMPGLYLVGVEFPGSAVEPPDAIHHFDLHVALNRSSGQAVCDVATVSQASKLVPGECAAQDATTFAATKVSGALEWGDVDDFFLGCGPEDAPADPQGGMPDVVHAFDVDLPEGAPALLDVVLTFPDGPPGQGTVLALTGAPCGASDAVIDCAWGSGDTLILKDITVFPGERIYAVVDGIGEDALDATLPLAYELEWKVSTPCP